MDNVNFKKIDFNTAKGAVMLGAVVVIIIVIVFFGKDLVQGVEKLFGSIGSGLGITTPQAVTDANAANIKANLSSANPSSPFSPAMYNNNPDASTLDYATLSNMAGQIYESGGIFSASGSSGLAAIKQCNNQIDVSNLSIVFQQLYNLDLYDYMASQYQSNTNVLALNQILSFVSNLPLV